MYIYIYIYIIKLTIVVLNIALAPGQAIIWTSTGILLTGPQGTNFNWMLLESHTVSLKKMHLKISSAAVQQFCPDPNVLKPARNTISNKPRYIPGEGQDLSTRSAKLLSFHKDTYNKHAWAAPGYLTPYIV